MKTLALIPFMLAAFAVRDFLLLKMGVDAKTFRRLLLYAVVVFVSTVVFFAATVSVENDRLLQILRAPRVVWPVMLFYGALAAVSFRIRLTDRHDLAWPLAAIPNPVLVLGLSVLTRFVFHSASPYISIMSAVLFTSLWIAVIVLSVWVTMPGRLEVAEMDFSVNLASVVNLAAILVMPLGAWIERPSL
jgi:hypothetical protein